MTELQYTHAGGIVTKIENKDTKYLLVQSSEDSSHWIFPKGHVKPGESLEMAALREVLEEAGIKAEIISTLGESRFTKKTEKVRVLYFLMRYKTFCYTRENREVRWCNYEEAIATLSFDDAREILKRTMEIST